ncbi:4'-phosphopantetheinyl transferase family protein [Noviherbaspirillum galbum]|uniref:4'-phosphopantetheinyl transferase superfamily protein n=1 Tax=Noviherbaspirillum galbum TaxID=2709383 RepID=A0A6B3SFU5_9BURK|nr:4'-phosphopantetheinyl transferase superfamily protein [Noviherbaspirillum galbum]NEX59528.1 4'-phosphopantetheinyl transferase superfamily protein [Noviherbaspirillum galbum]
MPAPPTTLRAEPRRLLRDAVRRFLGGVLHCAPDAVPLVSQPGEAPRVSLPDRRIFLSFSHEPGLSLAALHAGGPVGVDLMDLAQAASLEDWQALASDYLGPRALAAIRHRNPPSRPKAFALAWTSQEARLKCSGLPLEEWSEALEARLAGCECIELELPAGYAGILAYQRIS